MYDTYHEVKYERVNYDFFSYLNYLIILKNISKKVKKTKIFWPFLFIQYIKNLMSYKNVEKHKRIECINKLLLKTNKQTNKRHRGNFLIQKFLPLGWNWWGILDWCHIIKTIWEKFLKTNYEKRKQVLKKMQLIERKWANLRSCMIELFEKLITNYQF